MRRLLLIIPLLMLPSGVLGQVSVRRQAFDGDPGWDGHNNRGEGTPSRPVRQDFGFSSTSHAGGAPGEMGGFITPAAEPAYYGLRMPQATLRGSFTASGRLAVTGRKVHALVAFFHTGSLNEWRTPNTIALRLMGRGEHFYAYVEYATAKWRAGGDSPQGFTERRVGAERPQPIEFPLNRPLDWSLTYDPEAHKGLGAVIAVLDGRTAICHLDAGHKQDGARFNRFGLLNILKSVDDGGEIWLDDVAVNGAAEHFDRPPRWEERGNRREYVTPQVRPRFDFGYTPTRRAGGAGVGEIGGTVFRGDCRYPEKIAWYADSVGPFDLSRRLRAGGRVALRRGVSDSTTLLGFFDSRMSAAPSESQRSGFPDHFLGIAIEGPSSEGFFVYPAYRTVGEGAEGSRSPQPNRIYPDGMSHRWTLEYLPEGDGGGAMAVTLGTNRVRLRVDPAHRKLGARFDRFGLITTRIDGNAQEIYFDDLTYGAD